MARPVAPEGRTVAPEGRPVAPEGRPVAPEGRPVASGGRTVVLHPGALGDVLLSVPTLRALRRPGDERVLAAQSRIGRLLVSLGVVERDAAFDTLGLDALFGDAAPAERLRQLVDGARVVSWFGSGDAGYRYRLRALASDAVVASTAPAPGTTVWEHLVASIGVRSADVSREAIALTPAIVAKGARALAAAGWDGARPLIIVHPGAGGASKRWSVEGFAVVAVTLAESFGAQLVVHEGPADHDAVTALQACLRVPALHLADPSLDALAGAAHHGRLWIGNDSGVTHLAAAVGAPTLALFLAANLPWRPWSPEARVHVVSAVAASRADVDAVTAEAAALLTARAPQARLARHPTAHRGGP